MFCKKCHLASMMGIFSTGIYRKINPEEKKRDVSPPEAYKKLVNVFCYLLCSEIDS